MPTAIDSFQPSRFHFFGPVKDLETLAAVADHLETQSLVIHAPEQEKSPEREQQIRAVADSVLLFAQDELQIDLANRAPNLDKVHFFSKHNYQMVRDQFRLRPTTVATYTKFSDVLIMESATIEGTLGNLQHELIHLLSYRAKNICGTETEVFVKPGYAGYHNERNQALAMVEEALTEMVNIEVMVRFWGDQEALRDLQVESYKDIGYIEQIIIIDELLKRIADTQDTSYLDILRHLQRGKFLGQMQSLRVLTQEIGRWGMKSLAKWTSLDPNHSIAIAKELRLPVAIDKILGIRNKRPIQIMERVVPNIVYD